MGITQILHGKVSETHNYCLRRELGGGLEMAAISTFGLIPGWEIRIIFLIEIPLISSLADLSVKDLNNTKNSRMGFGSFTRVFCQPGYCSNFQHSIMHFECEW